MASNDTASDETSIHALLSAFAMIVFSEIGDKTFLIAAILAMRHPRMVVFAGAFVSLVIMSILSAMMGHILPALLPKSITELAAALLFFAFGGKMFHEGREMKSGNQKLQEEMKEAQEEIEEDDVFIDGTNGIPLEAIEEGGRSRHPRSKSPGGPTRSLAEGFRNFFSFFLGPVFVQAFVLTFLGEWGDRSQISTIALGAAHDVYLVALGTVIGHSCCTAGAVIAGRYISTKIDVKYVTLAGAMLFILFGFIYAYEFFVDISATPNPEN
ncbi:UPF0016-domain-containing protein [Thelephora ganbajun]|uniref:UPF0016-domain-containing protein n=1 Tax=Thelephora ganbajun TaxID=370292 RepID=A0ACB6Z2Q4_THEGA|nr:UPF0016-domain-containing protein [Thelephora ganbajun]